MRKGRLKLRKDNLMVWLQRIQEATRSMDLVCLTTLPTEVRSKSSLHLRTEMNHSKTLDTTKKISIMRRAKECHLISFLNQLTAEKSTHLTFTIHEEDPKSPHFLAPWSRARQEHTRPLAPMVLKRQSLILKRGWSQKRCRIPLTNIITASTKKALWVP